MRLLAATVSALLISVSQPALAQEQHGGLPQDEWQQGEQPLGEQQPAAPEPQTEQAEMQPPAMPEPQTAASRQMPQPQTEMPEPQTEQSRKEPQRRRCRAADRAGRDAAAGNA